MVKPKVYLVSSEDQCPHIFLKHFLEKEFGCQISAVEKGTSGMLQASQKMIEDSDVVIAIGPSTFNGSFELGMAHAMGRPIFAIYDVSTAPTGHLLTAPTEVFFPKKDMLKELFEALGRLSLIHSDRNAPIA